MVSSNDDSSVFFLLSSLSATAPGVEWVSSLEPSVRIVRLPQNQELEDAD